MPYLFLLTVLGFAEASGPDEAQDRSRKEAPAPAPTAKVGFADVGRLVEQLGSESFALREEATRKLAAIGEPVFPALRKAAASHDPEVRRRVARLLGTFEAHMRRRQIEVIKRKFEAIQKSDLPPNKKGPRLKSLISIGMTKREVEWIFDSPTLDRRRRVIYYERCGLSVFFDEGLQVQNVEHSDEAAKPIYTCLLSELDG